MLLTMSQPSRRRFGGVVLACAVLVGACSGLVESTPPTATTPVIGGEGATPWIPSAPSGLTCGSAFPAPGYASMAPVAGISLRAIDKGHFEVRNATARTYYVAVFYWETADNLVCGRGVTFRDSIAGAVDPGSTFLVDGGSTTEVPATVSIWDAPCGEACDRPPIGQYVVPLSSIEPPVPMQT
jgi:hypothetical protein